MRLPIDTHTFRWFVLADRKLSAPAQNAIADPKSEVLLSPASFWEIAIKLSTKKLALDQPFLPFIEEQIEVNRISVLAIEPKHAAVLTTLPFHHRDPFDRLIVSQAIGEAVPLVSSDKVLDAYGVQRIW